MSDTPRTLSSASIATFINDQRRVNLDHAARRVLAPNYTAADWARDVASGGPDEERAEHERAFGRGAVSLPEYSAGFLRRRQAGGAA
jgi:hypothetical protein